MTEKCFLLEMYLSFYETIVKFLIGDNSFLYCVCVDEGMS